jgi:signal transduction histidine kinase
LERAGRVRENLLLNMTHELRTPLNAIMGLIGTLLPELPGAISPEQEAQLRQVAAAAEHLLTLIADLLDLAALESGRLGVTLGDVSCRDILTEVAALVEPRAAEHGVKVEVVPAEVDACVRADRGIVSRILLLLTREAVQSAEAGLVRLGAEPDGDGVNLRVARTGLIASRDGADLADWFGEAGAEEPVPDLERRRSLYLAQRLAALMDVRIELLTTPGQGGTLMLRLPAAGP